MSSLRDRHAGKVAYATVAAAAPGDGRTAWSADDGERETAPRVPIIGVDAGAMPLTKPGTPAWLLKQEADDLLTAGRELMRRKLRAARGRA